MRCHVRQRGHIPCQNSANEKQSQGKNVLWKSEHVIFAKEGDATQIKGLNEVDDEFEVGKLPVFVLFSTEWAAQHDVNRGEITNDT